MCPVSLHGVMTSLPYTRRGSAWRFNTDISQRNGVVPACLRGVRAFPGAFLFLLSGTAERCVSTQTLRASASQHENNRSY